VVAWDSAIVCAVRDPAQRRPLRVGHKGAAHIEPGNTLASFDAALRCGVDMIEFDVLSENADGSGRLLVAHDHEAAHSHTPLTFELALAHLASEEFAGVGGWSPVRSCARSLKAAGSSTCGPSMMRSGSRS